jgi:hypothetical protein
MAVNVQEELADLLSRWLDQPDLATEAAVRVPAVQRVGRHMAGRPLLSVERRAERSESVTGDDVPANPGSV